MAWAPVSYTHLLRYEKMEPAVFLERPNRFVAYVERAGRREICHVKNTGRCRELLVPGAELYVQRSDNPARKTALDLIAVKKGSQWVNMDSQAPNKAAAEWLRQGGLGCREITIDVYKRQPQMEEKERWQSIEN